MADINDLMEITGKGRQAVAGAIDRGELPGYRIGAGRKFWIPDDALAAVKAGTWITAAQRKHLNMTTTPFLTKRPPRGDRAPR